jgi:hypothetical protein
VSVYIFDVAKIAHPHRLFPCFLRQRLRVHHEAGPTMIWEALSGEGGRIGDVVCCGGSAMEADDVPGGGERDDRLVEEGGEGGVRNQLLGVVVATAAA